MANTPEWEPMVQKTVMELRDSLIKLHTIWEEIGFDKQIQSSYCDQVYGHIKDLLSDMIVESEQRKRTLIKDVKQLMENIANLSKELGNNVNIDGYVSMPLIKLDESLRNDVQKLLHLKEQRLSHIKELLAKEIEICKSLGVQSMGISSELLSEEEIDNFKFYIEKQEAEKNRLESTFRNIRQVIIKMMDDLGVVPISSFEELVYNNPDDFVFTALNMAKLKELQDKLSEQVTEVKQQVEEMKQELIVLWKYLEEPDDACQAFLNSYVGYSSAVMNALSAEIERCKAKRREHLVKYVSQIRNDLVNLWDLCKFGESQRDEFTAFHSHTYTEDLLTLHELEVKRIRQFYNTNRTIFDLLHEREKLWIKMEELAQRANNPDRFHNRGGQLLAEERERKVIQKKLPKIEEQLNSLIKEYEITYREVFTINGMTFEELVAESWASLNIQKETIKKARKEAKDKSIKKGTLSASKRTPIASTSRCLTPLTSSKRRLVYQPSPNRSTKHPHDTSGTNRPIVYGSKIRRSGKLSRRVLMPSNATPKSSKTPRRHSRSSTIDTTYEQFQEHLTDKEELRSSLISDQILKNANKSNAKTIVRTPVKPLRRNLGVTTTPSSSRKPLSTNKSPRSPRIIHTPRLVTVPSALPIIF